ncbi:MAG TPA: pyruvate dehydrogenase complex dihydrolipoamide acetyltransferase [Xanthobacteraceae bacterium]|nr:pyruvate dehydrogenase complex dihydrolipoamide acetyltransferase [Xanthobacteraceae bacterium]
MPINILMPALSPTMEKGNLAKWLKKEGDKVKAGDVLAEIETDKATMEYEAIEDGVLAKILVQEGTADVAVNEPIAVLAAEGEDLKAVVAPSASATKPAVPSEPHPAPSASPKTGRDEAPQKSQNPSSSSGRTASLSEPGAAPATNGHAGRIFASPLARRLAKAAGIDVVRIAGTGPHGRIVARDVEAAMPDGAALRAPVPQRPAPQPPVVAPVQPPADDNKIRALFEPGSYEVVPHDNMRKIIAQRLVLAKQTIPHFYLTISCTLDKLLSAREDINVTAPKGADGKPAWKLSVNDFVIKALALALIKVPQANVTWTETGMLKHKRADIGVAVAIPGGLITPVIRKAETKSLIAISAEMKDYAARARARKLKPEEYQGGSSAISNLGMYGIEEFAAVINPPHATILAVGAGVENAVVRDGKLAIATQMKVTLSTDHRAVDGALGAELIGAFKTYIESPTAMLV